MIKPDKKRGLGRGLSALMSDVSLEQAPDTPSMANTVEQLPIEWIHPNPDQPRKQFKSEDMDELIASVKEKGVIQPLIVRRMDAESYQIVAGERRWRAAQEASLHELPVVVREFSDTEVLEIAIIENIQRSDLNAIEEAAGYKQLMERFGHTQERLAEALGKSRSYIANLLRLLNLPERVQTMVQDGKLSAGHARALITAEDPNTLASKVVSEGLSVRATEQLAKKPTGPNKRTGTGTKSASKDADTKALEADLTAGLGMKVSIAHDTNGEAGTVTIRYTSLDGLDDLCQKLSS